MIITFAGHRIIYNHDEVKKKVKIAMKDAIFAQENIVCLCGGYGDFDKICAIVCLELKAEGVDVEMVYVTPYITPSEQKKINEIKAQYHYDSIVYPPIENTPLRFAISKRNEWMMSQADVVIAYVKHSYGGAYQSILFAEKRKKRVINLYKEG